MGDFSFYFSTGWHHIISWEAADHLLFILALTAIYLLSNWKQVLILVTAFTIGHSLTLALSVYKVISARDHWVEFLIPCTIIVTALFNLLLKDYEKKNLRLNYFLALFFGLIHGLGYANTIRYMMAKEDQGFGWNLFSFNLGLEAGQILVVLSILMISYLLVNTVKLKRKWWVGVLSTGAFCIALKMAMERWPL